ncbi:alkanesulfonate monooxygenase SsuD/methylene tetrahydromethanopterin reductase-like flavin-dependent oxidoreductase (luciferase family) [Kribbella amoyensis]|uniref:Alkanesulfonate monooxygenase SsuD/methylene tetrahydromethanopterin reductase-like flavin-dependent oxidoreductase (Luciferase family) n=1 Tax=Kribbella amoyensis TaxID=996641 RepID=A0A561BTY7_9ACTN|nr:LLM class flavin-dependent oxidoreductase [Kribbella amoyensis]TWD82293.1 alkanesulfonate monooxygenase SsuD/methylene tetrahydromethanopterin reductase-like flavin-dependent oxidoreductase (luciferase family) [Kribbella amoyensis]
MTIKVGVLLPTSTPDPRRPVLGDIRGAARAAEVGGLESLWATDHLVASAPMLDSTVVLATAAAVTERIRVGFGVMLLALRPVAWAAKQVSSLQFVSGDRMLLGVGTGNPAHGDIGWRAAGVSYQDRGRLTDESLRVLPDLIAGRTAALPDGLEVAIAPGATVPPILVAGDGMRAMERAAQFGDGWVSIGLAVEDVAARLAVLGELAEKYERPRPAVTVVAPVFGDDAAKLAAYGEAGVERVILPPTEAGWERDVERAAEVQAAV